MGLNFGKTFFGVCLSFFWYCHRLLYSLVLRADLQRLYPNESREAMGIPARGRKAIPLQEAYPEWEQQQKLLFYDDMRLSQEHGATDMICTSRLTVGSKIGNGGHERVCRK